MSRLTLIVMALVMSLAGSAYANDGARLIYDLTELGRQNGASVSSEMMDSHGAPQPARAERSSRHRSSSLSFDWSGGNLELSHNRGRTRSRQGTTVHQTQTPDNRDNGETFNNATPTPEPGTLLLMGSGLVAGARMVRRRRDKSL